MEMWEVIVRECVRDVMARYNAYGDRGAIDDMVALFAPDAVMTAGERVCHGRDEIRTIFTGGAAVFKTASGARAPRVKHFTTSPQIDVDSPTSARARCWYQVVMNHGLDHWGSYKDEFTVVDGRWMFKSRRVTTDGVSDKSLVTITPGK
ncbi:MAG TPA: nuclear transport factor 2 family protein [Burkholderiales bacterium]|nr:nuclear transport factor 2 family protein [Burkholderiales bacterium]